MALRGIKEILRNQKVAIYIRVSTQWQIDKDSLKVQRRELEAFSELVLGIKDYVVFEDAGYSAKNTSRPDYQAMMDRLRTGEFSHLLVWKIDRISRNLLDFSEMYEELNSLGVTFVSKNEQFDTSSAIGEAMLRIILVFAELERKMTAERVTQVMLSRAEKGVWNGGRVPFGYAYNKETGEFTLQEHEYTIVKRIFNMYEEMQSLTSIATWLNERHFLTRQGNEWSITSLYKILTNVWYIGSYRYNVHREGSGYKKRDESEWVVIENHHVPAVTDIQFNRIQFLLKRNKRGGVPVGESYVKKNIHIFGGLVTCDKCGANMSATLDRRRASGFRPSIYGCSTRRKNRTACDNKYLSDIVIGPFIFNYVSNLMRTKAAFTPNMSIEAIEKRLLRGNCFLTVDHIEKADLEKLQEIFRNGQSGIEFRAPSAFTEQSSAAAEFQALTERKNKQEAALGRLKALYLYNEEALPEKEFVSERQRILDELERIDNRLSELSINEADTLTMEDDFIQKSSYFLMIDKLSAAAYIDYEKYIRIIDPATPRNFIHNIIKEIRIRDGQIVSIEFRSGMIQHFVYK